MKIVSLCRALGTDNSGVAAVEYSFLASLIAMALVGALAALGVSVSGLWGDVETAVSGTSFQPDGNS